MSDMCLLFVAVHNDNRSIISYLSIEDNALVFYRPYCMWYSDPIALITPNKISSWRGNSYHKQGSGRFHVEDVQTQRQELSTRSTLTSFRWHWRQRLAIEGAEIGILHLPPTPNSNNLSIIIRCVGCQTTERKRKRKLVCFWASATAII